MNWINTPVWVVPIIVKATQKISDMLEPGAVSPLQRLELLTQLKQ